MRMQGAPSSFLDRLFSSSFKSGNMRRLGAELAERVAAGGYPPALARDPGRRRREWYRNYVESLVQKDVRELARVHALDALQKDRSLLGQLLETFVAQELQRLAGWHQEPHAFHHFRDKEGHEVDFGRRGGQSLRNRKCPRPINQADIAALGGLGYPTDLHQILEVGEMGRKVAFYPWPVFQDYFNGKPGTALLAEEENSP